MFSKMFVVSVLAVVFVTSPLTVESLECYQCSNVTNLAGCNTLVNCQTGEVCHSEFSTIGGERWYSLGCNAAVSCPPKPTVGAGSGALVGRSVSAQDDHCSECCESGLCNRQLCQNYDHKCEDATYCSVMGSLSNICTDVDHIKTVCQRHCGLCSLVDGGWSQWNTWSACDRTCDNGTMTRTRMCNNPAPANGGATCAGSHQETANCSTNINCPVPGGWSQWSSWGTCSATCDIGIQGRDRSCSHPHPAYGGDSCFGDGRGDRICLPGPCAEGGWSAWGSWGSCSRSCDVGLRARSRLCNNPTPSLVGTYCVGDSSQSETCTMVPCQGPVVFYANGLTNLSPGNNATLIFSQVRTNVGNAYNSHTGIFTAPVGGTYSFAVLFCTNRGKSVWVGLYINHVEYQRVYCYSQDHVMCKTISVSVLLKQGDTVHAKTTVTATGYTFYTELIRVNTFSGALMRLK